MRKQNLKRYKIYKFGEGDINGIIDARSSEYKEFYVSPSINLKLSEISLSESAFFNIYLQYFNKKYEKDMLLENVIIVELNNKHGLAELQTGIDFNGETYTYLITTPSWTKHEDDISKGACMMIRKKDIAFKIFFENLISLGEIEKYKGKDKKINTEHARLALSLSTAYMTKLKPKAIIVDECNGIITSDIVTVINKKVIEITDSMGDEELKKYRNVPVTQFDGCGLMSMEFANEIKIDGDYKHPITWCGIRIYNTATKGLLVSFDFKKYIHKFYGEDTDYIEKRENGKIYIKNMFNKWQCVDDADILINASMAKWADHFGSLKQIYEKVNDEKYENYKDIIENLWITKVNKPYSEIEKYNLTNYQLLGNLNLSSDELKEIYKPTENMFNRLLDGDIDATFLYLNLLKGKKFNSDGENDDIEEDEAISVSTVAEQLIAKNPNLIKSDYVKKHVARMIKKQLNLLCSGKAYVESYYKTVTQDPISFCEWLINRTENEKFVSNHRGLKEHQFYCSDTEDGDIRTCSRNPLASFSEILNLSFVHNNFLDDWYGHLSKDLVICNCHDLTKEIASGMDFDTDTINVANHPIIRNAVKTDLPFINIEDINKEKPSKKWTDNNRYSAFITSTGNLIGKIANMTSSVSAEATSYNYYNYIYNKTEEAKTYKELWDAFHNTFTKDIVKENKRNKVYLIQDGNYVLDYKGEKILRGSYLHFKTTLEQNFTKTLAELSEEEIHKQIDKGFEDYKRDSYYLRILSMKAIDVPKTLIPIEKDEYKEEKDKYGKNPYFLGYRKGFYDEKGKRIKYIFHENALDINASRIYDEIISKRKELEQVSKTSTSKELIQKFFYNPTEKQNEHWEECKNEIVNLYDYYKNNRSKIKLKYDELIKNTENEAEKAKYEEEKIKLYKLHDIDVLERADGISAKYNDYRLISSILATETSETFMFNYFNCDCFKMLDETSITVQKYQYIPDINGDIEFKFKNYRKEPIEIKINDEELQENIRLRFLNKKSDKFKDTKIRIGYIDVINHVNLESYKNNNTKFHIGFREYKESMQPALLLDNTFVAFVYNNQDLLCAKGEDVIIKEIIKNNAKSAEVIVGIA
ncbi:hypothetical protein CPAST_c34910 [Clostridium pasteurianum DSM 525 = ATCC 6013]|uniref:Uncharacterized protein n=1 Tax=Clostridium pasteurianum DSM 525 = ATCC 6013 TaxID=1262449 RepID=A0A0H3J8K2_CLOPA|nr:hypothetical protein [Clostridium pasteurianum]AJA49552.1 hypothetical protein CPAST_c34910 [Clostridium pasteurianum DSM 525 = ATCC 6013]AJA53540.1 hypothetical protein CLPA_c34910 [Clostridium pasteurianum DSM 525 = ATCC 6013]AOZ76706.1 hypothetical protein AQ983_16950 [Clostridium pasteurianum DSM 525 = ATCC 6013]ELP58932.1 hypothetical protein F502_12426 [Clostridium pasteurianum DSM 525 = ATCC 6013]KRU14435.1 hypothetical protein CP6013_03693 [Clostridium pasteurianum DSM 525 = ATCC 60